MVRMENVKNESRGWCRACESVMPGSEAGGGDGLICLVCGESMVSESSMTPHQRALWKFIEWQRGVMARGEWGPSPGGAASELKCARATVDDLVRGGILERVEYEADGFKVIMISSRSIERAKDNMRRTGRWMGITGVHHEYE